MTDYSKLIDEMEAEDDGLRASQAVTPAGQMPTMRFTDTPATAKAVLRSPNPQGEVPTWEQMSITERLMNGLEGGYHGLQKSRAATAAYEAEQAAQAGLSALVDDDEDESVKELLSRDTQVNRDYKAKQAAARDQAIYDYADLAKKDKEYVTPQAIQNASERAKGKGFWAGLGAAVSEMAADPLNSALYLGTSSLGAIAPYMALSAAGGGLLGAARLTSVARAVQMATMFKGSYDNELGNYLIQAMQEKGIDLQNPDAMRTALQADDLAETYEKGKKRAAVVGAFDAVAALAAPIRLNPSNAVRTVRDAAGILKASGLQGVDKVKSIPEAFGMARAATPTSRGGMWGYNLENHLTQAGLQGVLGGAGEALGSLAAGDEINWADVLFEAIGELTSAPVEVVSMTASVNAAYNAQQQQAQAAKVLGENMQKVTAAVAAMGTQVKDGQTIADWANDVGQDKSVFSFAQDLVDAGVPDKIRQAVPELAARIETAAQNKTDIAIPVSDVVQLAAQDEAAANSLLYESRVVADGMSPRQAEDFMKNGKQEAVAAFDKIVKDTKPDAEMRKAIDAEVDVIRKQLIDAGTAEDVADLQTRPWASWLAIRAKQTGLSPKEIMGKMNLRIRRQQSQKPGLQQFIGAKGNARMGDDAAAERMGLSPREMQSITWEAVRVLFEPNRKKALRSVIDGIWKEFDAGKISVDEARQKIFDAAGGLSKLSWQDTPFNDRITETYDRSGVTLYDDVRQPEPEPVLTMEAAPDPNNAEAVAQWNELSPADKLAVTREIVPWVLERVAEQTHTHIGEPELQRGGYLGDPNYSILCRIADSGDYVKVGRLLASYLRQDSVMAISQTNGEGMFSSKVIRIQLPDGFTEAQVDDLYRNHIDRIRDANGERLIMGQSTAGGVMMLSVDAENIEAIKAGLNSIVEGYGDQMVYRVSDAYTGFLEPYSEEEKTNARNDTGRSGGVRQETSVGYDADLQSETDQRLAEAIKAKIASRPRGFNQEAAYGTEGVGDDRTMGGYSAEGGNGGVRAPGEGQAAAGGSGMAGETAGGMGRESGTRADGGGIYSGEQPNLRGGLPLRAGGLSDKEAAYQTDKHYGKPRKGSSSVLGFHFSREPRTMLDSSFYGTGFQGAEADRLSDPQNEDIRHRIYFYADADAGVIPESEVGQYVHTVNLDNVYNVAEDPLGIVAKAEAEGTNYERDIMKAGFDGYYRPYVESWGQGGVVLIGDHKVDVEPKGVWHRTPQTKLYNSIRLKKVPLDGAQLTEDQKAALKKMADKYGYRRVRVYDEHVDYDESLAREIDPILGKRLTVFASAYTAFNQSSETAFTPDEELIRKAVDNFGTTDNIDEAFYILPDGTMLDGSGRHWGLDEQDVNGRQVDHADVAEVMDSSGAQAMYDFMGRTGAMRIDSAHGVASISRPPTPAQLEVLGRSSEGNYLALSYNTPEGRIVDDTEFDSASPEEIGTFFAEAEEKAALGIAGAYAQTAYHGSPFKFDRFTLDHIGAGAGTQQHGYGLYFAMNRKTAEGYRDALAGGGEYTVNGKPVSRNLESTDMEDLAATWVLREMPGTQKHPKPAQVKRAAETAIKRLNEDTERGQVDKATSSKLRNELAKIYRQPKDYSFEYTPSTEGRVYRTDIPDSDVLLSEEAAMVDQPVVVRKALQNLAFDLVAEGMDDLDKGTTSPRVDARNKVIELIGKDSAEGRDIYSWLTAYAGGSKEASELLNLYGIKGLEYFSEPDGNCAVIWDDTALKILNSLEQPEQSGTRGSMMPSNAGDVRPGEGGVMTLMESADKSTFLHESAHAWLDADTMLAQDIADKVLAGGELTDGEKAFLTNLGGFFRWGQQEGVLDLGVTDDLKTVAAAVRAWAAMPINDQRGMHELFAEGFESYLLEGVSPNAEMKTIFGRFKKWLMDIYAQATRQPHPISPEVRKLYDLMFATEQQAMETQQKLGMRALFDGEIGKRLGMTDEEMAAYNALNEEATQEAEGLVAKAVHGVLRIYGNIRRKEARRILRERRDEVNKRTDEILEEPRFRALSLLTHGLKNEDGTTSRMTIELKTLSRCGIDAETAQMLMDRGWVTEGRGVSPEVLANTAGTTDVVGLIGDLLELKSMNDAKTEAIKSVAYKVRIESGMNPDAFDELQSNLAAHNETRSRFITAEFNALARALGKRQLMVSAAREYAVEQIGNMKLSDIRPGTFMNAERRCAAMAEQAMRKGDFGACLEAKRGQVLNHEMARAALEALDRYQRGVRMAKRAMKSKTVHPDYKKLILALLDAHSVASMTAKEREDFGKLAADPAQLQELIKEVEDAGTPIEGLQRFIDSHEHAKDMTGYDSQDFFSVLKQLETLGRNVYNQNLAEELGRIDEIVKEGKEAIKEAADRQGRDVIENERVPFTRWERWRDNVHQFLLNHVKIQSWCRIFDQNQSGGFFWNLFIRSANERSTFENSMRAKVSKTLAEKLAPVFKKSQDEDPVIIPGFSKPFTHGQRIAVALNCGNDSNRQRLVDGDCRFTDDALQDIFATLTEADWRAVEAVWQQFEELRPLIAEKEKRVFGTEPEWIDYQPFMVKTAEGKIIQVSGGYYPVKFDPRGSNRAAKYADANDVRQEMQGAYQSATTRRSFTKSRVQGDVHMPLRIDLAALYEGFNDVIHDLAWHEWLIETKRVLDGVNGRDSGLRQAIKERYGYLVAKQFEDWRKDIATGGRDSADSWVNRMAANVGVATMGFSVTSAFVQLTGIGYVIPRVGIAPVMTAVGKFISDPAGLHGSIIKKSEAMRLRGLTQNREIAQVRNRLESGKHWFKDHAYVMMTIMQNIVDSITWQAAYERYTREGNSEDKAIAMADQVVIDTQSSGNVSDLSAIERSQGARLFTVFYSWMNAALNMGVVEAMGENDRAKAAARLLFMGAVMPVLEALFREALQAHDSDDDDDEDWTKQWLRKPLGDVVEYHLGLFLGLREVSSTAKSLIAGEPLFGYNGPAGTRMIANTANAMQAATDPLSWRGLKVLVDIAGSLTGAPSTQINRTIKGIRAIESGQAEGVDAVLAPLFGFSGKIDE